MGLSSAAAAEPAADAGSSEDESASAGRVIWTALGYLPSRALDVVDVVRARARIGPGVAFAARATESADLFLGRYTSLYVGLPGPRGGVIPRLPVGVESRSGAEVSVADLSTGVGLAPTYSSTEIGIGLQIFAVGVDVGIDPVELADLLAGFLLIDLRDDDL
jgi:hypothetical protein